MYVARVLRGGRLALVAMALAVAACRTDKPPPDHTASNPDETAPSTVTTPTTASPTTAALGERVTTVEEAQRLLDLFAKLDGDAVRMLVAKGAPDADFHQALETVYVGQALDTVRKVYEREASLNFAGYLQPQPDTIFRARRIEDGRRTNCVVVSGTLDVRPRYTNPVEAINGIFVLVVQTGIFPSGGNPTRWRILVAGEPETGTDLQAICPAL